MLFASGGSDLGSFFVLHVFALAFVRWSKRRAPPLRRADLTIAQIPLVLNNVRWITVGARSVQTTPDFRPRALDYDEFLAWRNNILLPGAATFVSFSVLAGDISADQIEFAWQILCRRHPMIGARIEAAARGARFVPLDAFPKARIRTRESENAIEECLRFSRDADLQPGAPLFQAFAVIDPRMERHVFLLVVNHAGGDGSASMTLHDEFIDLLNTPPQTPDQPVRVLPPSARDLLAGERRIARFFINGIADATRQHRCSMFPYEVSAPFDERKTRVMIALADPEATRSARERASREYGFTTFMNARLLKIQFDRLRAQGLCGARARLPLYVPINLRRILAAPIGSMICNATSGYTTDVPIEDNLDVAMIAQRIHEKTKLLRDGSIAQRLTNWYSPTLVSHALAGIMSAQNHFGSYTTHLGGTRLHNGRARRRLYHGFALAHGCFLEFFGASRIQHDRLFLTMTYCEPVVKRSTAEYTFGKLLEMIGLDPADAVVRDYDDLVGRLSVGR